MKEQQSTEGRRRKGRGWRKCGGVCVPALLRWPPCHRSCSQGFSVVDMLVRVILCSSDFPEHSKVCISSPIPTIGAYSNVPPPVAAIKSGSNFDNCPLLWGGIEG